MLGDFFKIQNNDELNFRQINNLIIEARRTRIHERAEPSRKRLNRIDQEKESARIQRAQERIEKIADEEKRVAEANKLAEQIARREHREETLEQRIEETMQRFNRAQTKQEKEVQDVNEKRTAEKEQIRDDARSEGDAKRAERQNIREDAENRSAEAHTLQQEFLNSYESAREEFNADLETRRAELNEQESKQQIQSQQKRTRDKDALPSPAEFNALAKEAREEIIEAGHARAEERLKTGGLPEEKNKEFQARKEAVREAADARHKPIEELFDEAYAEILKELKARVDLAYEKGDIHRDEKGFITNKARTIVSEFLHTMLVRRWFNMFNENRSFKAEHRWYKYIALRIFKELRARRTKATIEHAQDTLKALNLLLEKQRQRQMYREGLRQNSIQRDTEYPLPINENILSDTHADEGTSLFEKHIEKIIRDNKITPPQLTPEKYGHEKDNLITYLDDAETRHPDAESLREIDRSSPSSPFRNPNKQFNDVITYIDNVEEQEQEKADMIEFTAQLADDIKTQKEADDHRKTLIDRFNDDKENRDRIIEEQKKIRMKIYSSRLVELNNHLAHKKAVELGQFINLFF